MTPWQSLIASKATNKRREGESKLMMAQAWHTAAFTRAKRLPPFNRVVGDTDGKPKSADHVVQALKAKFGVATDG